MKRAFFVGRFQPFHNGHLSFVQEMDMAGDVDEIVIGVGSAQYANTQYNPFTLGEREKMVRSSIRLRKPWYLIYINDVHDYQKWVPYVESLCPRFHVVYSGSTITSRLFKEKKYEVRTPSQDRKISATRIRNMMLIGEEWREYVPKGTEIVLDEIGGVERIRRTSTSYATPCVMADVIINYTSSRKSGIVMIKRKNEPFKDFWALPGGYMDAGRETIEEAAAREAMEETSIALSVNDLKLLGVYSEPGRDPRGHYVSVAYYADAGENNGIPRPNDDAKELGIFGCDEIPVLAFDHATMLQDYFNMIEKERRMEGIP